MDVPSVGRRAEDLRSEPPAVRVLVLTAPVGDGHLAAARAIASGIRRQNADATVTVRDVLPALPRPLRWLLSDAYRWQLSAAPWLFGVLFGALERSRLLRRLAFYGLSLAGSRSLRRLLRSHPADVVVSTWPAATIVLGSLRLRGKLRVPVCTTITDFAGLELWSSPGVDLHLVMHESLVPKVERVAGHGSARPVSPLVTEEFLVPRSAAEARRALGLPPEGTIVLVSGGGWGVGDIEGAVRTALRIDGAHVVCLAGRDADRRAQIEHAFNGHARLTVLPFTERMSELLAAADVVVHSTGGVTCLEALTLGCPIVAYGAPPGHAARIADEMATLGLLAHARTTAELLAALAAALRTPSVAVERTVDAATLALSTTPRVAARLRARLAHGTATMLAFVAVLFVLFASDATYPIVAEALSLQESTTVPTSRAAVALVVRGSRSDLLAFAPVAQRAQLRASVTSTSTLTRRDVRVLRRAGLDPIPELADRGVRSWFDARGNLERQLASERVGGHFFYLAPHEGFTITDYLLLRELGGTPIQTGRELIGRADDAGPLRRGDVVTATLGAGRSRSAVVAAARRLAGSGLAVGSVQQLTSGLREP